MSSDKKSIARLTVLKIGGIILGVGYSVLQIQFFGVSREIEIYFAASSVLYLITSLSQAGQLSEIFLPIYHSLYNSSGPKQADLAFSIVLNRIFLYSVLLVMPIAWFGAPLMIKLMIPGFSALDQLQAISIFRIMSFFLIIIFLSSFINTYLNANKIYGRAAIAGLISTLISIIILSLFYQTLGVWSLVLSFGLGKLISITYYAFILKSVRFNYSFKFSDEGFDHNNFFKSMFSTATYTGATQFYNVAITSSISFLPEGVYAVFKYTEQLFSKLGSLLISPMSTVYFTKLSSLIHSKESSQVIKTLRIVLNYGMFIAIGSAAILISTGAYLLGLLWKGDKFGPESMELAIIFLIGYSMLFIPQMLFAIYRKTIVALGHARKMYSFATISMIVSGIVSLVLIRSFNTTGLIFSIIIAKLLYFIIPIIIIWFYSRKYFVLAELSSTLKLTLAAIGAIFGANLYVGFAYEFENARLNDFVHLCSTSLIALALFYLIGYLARVPIILDIQHGIRKRIYKSI